MRAQPQPGADATGSLLSGMPSKYDTYTSPLAERNASPEMLRLWSARHKFNTWRRIWLAVAEAQHELTCGDARGAADGSRRVGFLRWVKFRPPDFRRGLHAELRAGLHGGLGGLWWFGVVHTGGYEPGADR